MKVFVFGLAASPLLSAFGSIDKSSLLEVIGFPQNVKSGLCT